MSLNISGHLFSLATPQVMGIVNVTPDSFYSASRTQTEVEIGRRIEIIVEEGGTMIDLGAYSSRPGADDVPMEEEMRRLRIGLSLVRQIAPEMPISVDTFRSAVARMAVEEGGAHIINDISGGLLDEKMFETVASLRVPYILMHMKGVPQTMQQNPTYDHFLRELFLYFADSTRKLQLLGARDIILDPGFGFGKTLEHNYQLMAHLEELHEFELPLLVGVSRKSMIYKLLDTTPEEALNGTTALHMVALQKGAKILRVHDVRAAVETVAIYRALQEHRCSQ